MSQPRLERHSNGKFYIHWTTNRRTARISTKRDSIRAAMLVYADWIAANIDMLFPPPDPEADLRRIRKARGLL